MADADLNAEDGYCYYVVLTGADGTQLEVDINSPAQITNDALINMAASLNAYCNLMVDSSSFSGNKLTLALINMAASLNAYCNLMVDSSSFSGNKLTLNAGTVQIQLPRITNNGESITCKEAALSLRFNGEDVDKKSLTMADLDENNCYNIDLTGLSFSVPALEDDQQVHLALNVTLSNGQELSTSGITWFASGGDLLDLTGLSFSVPALEDDQQVHLALNVTLSNGQELSTSGITWFASGGDLLLAVG